MSKSTKLYFGDFEGDAKVEISREGISIKYDDDLTGFSYMVIMCFLGILLYRVFTNDEAYPFWQTVFAILMVIGILNYLLLFIGFILGPLGKIFRNSKRIHVSKDIIYANSSAVDSKEVSKLGVAAKFASLAMAGAMSKQGKKIGRNVYMGAAAMVPSTYSKTSNIITFFHKNGLQGRLITDASSCNKIIDAVNQDDLNLVSEYLTYLNDSKINPDLSCSEVSSELKTLEDELSSKIELTKAGSSAKIRIEALAASEVIAKKIRLLGILYKQIKN
jgi:hypothetical protein